MNWFDRFSTTVSKHESLRLFRSLFEGLMLKCYKEVSSEKVIMKKLCGDFGTMKKSQLRSSEMRFLQISLRRSSEPRQLVQAEEWLISQGGGRREEGRGGEGRSVVWSWDQDTLPSRPGQVLPGGRLAPLSVLYDLESDESGLARPDWTYRLRSVIPPPPAFPPGEWDIEPPARPGLARKCPQWSFQQAE